MAQLGRPRTYHPDRPATPVERVSRHRLTCQAPLPPSGDAAAVPEAAALPLDLPGVPCRQCGEGCTVYCCDWQLVYRFLPRTAALVSDPPYDSGYDATKRRRRDSRWDSNFVGYDQAFDPTPWLQFAEVILCGADHYAAPLPPGAWCRWHKTQGKNPGKFAAHEWLWLSMPGPQQEFYHLWRGGQRAGEENMSRQRHKYHVSQKPVALMHYLVRQTTAPLVIDPFMGSGTTGVACIRLGRPFVGVEIDPKHFARACARLEAESAQLRLFAS